MSEDEKDYRVGYQRPPLHSRFQKGQSGNPEGGRRHRPRDGRRDGRLVALLAAALDAKMSAKLPGGARRRMTRRQAIVTGLVEQSAAGDLRATKLLLDLVLKTELAAPPPNPDDEDSHAVLIRELDRLAAAHARDPIE